MSDVLKPSRRAIAHDVKNLIQAALLALGGSGSLETVRDAVGGAYAILEAELAAKRPPDEARLPRPLTKDVAFVLDLWCGTGTAGPVVLDVRSSPLIIIDPWIVRRALLNVLLNARRASPATAPVRIEVSEEHYGAVIRVRDEGKGITPEDLTKIRAETPLPREDGHGLGLLGTARALVAAGGRLELESSFGNGTTATIRLPAVASTGKRAALAEGSPTWKSQTASRASS